MGKSPTDPNDTPFDLATLVSEPEWPDRLRDVDAATANRLLDEADGLRECGASGQRIAIGAYAGLSDWIDPADETGADRVRWLVREGEELPGTLELLLRRATTEAQDAEVRREAAIAVGSCLLARGETGRAEAHLRRQLAIVRGSGRVAEYAAGLRLTHVFNCQHRVFECLVLGRRTVELAERLRPEIDQAAAWNRLVYGLLALDAWEEVDAAIDALDRLEPAVPPPQRQRVAVWAAAARANRALQTGDHAESLDQLDLIQSSIEATGGGPEQLRPVHAWRGDVLWQAGRPDLAIDELGLALTDAGRDDVVAFRARHVLACCRRDLGDLRGARLLASTTLERLTSGLETEFGSGTLIQLGSRMGEVLTSCGELAQARAAYDLAGHAAVQRLVELDECVRSLPELSADQARDRVLLAHIRAEHVSSHRELLEAVARLFERALATGEPWAENLLDPQGNVQLCAWCHRYRTARGTWVPGGQYLAAHPRGRLTHGMCPDCFGDGGPRLRRLRRVD